MKHKGDTPRIWEMLSRTSPEPKHFPTDLTDDELAFIEGHLQGDGKLGNSVRFEMDRRAKGAANNVARWAIAIAGLALIVSVIQLFWHR